MNAPRLPPRPRTLSEVNERLDKIDSDIGAITAEVSSLVAEVASMNSRSALQRPPTPAIAVPPPHPFRDPEDSYHDFDEDVLRFRQTLRATARRNSERARQIAAEAVKTAERDGKAARWDKLVQTGWKVLVGVAVGVVVSFIIYRFGFK
jgi:hypothetical protein